MTQTVIVDDEVEILNPLEQMLSNEGYKVKSFSSSKEAEAYLASNEANLQSLTSKCLKWMAILF